MRKLLPKTSANPQGFTLIELLVVISIIAILSVIGITVFSGVQKGARDAKRKADVQAIATALEAQKNPTLSTYPLSVLPAYFGAGVIPTGPTTGETYSVTFDSTTAPTKFCVCTGVVLENGNGNATSVGAAGACAWSATGTFFCQASQQ